MTTITVDSLGDTTSTDDELTTLREALALANATVEADEIVFQNGLTGTILLGAGQLVVSHSVTIDGGGDVVVNAQGRSRAFDISGAGTAVTLEALTITGGRTTAGFFEGAGGGIRAGYGTSVTIKDSIVTGNRTVGDFAEGGGIAGDEVTITGSTVSGNRTLGNLAGGGGIDATTLTLERSTVSGNATSGYGATGGGIDAYQATVTNSTLAHNTTAGLGASGGAIAATELTLTNVTVTANSTSGAFAEGGGVAADHTTAVNSIVVGNLSGASGPNEIAGEVAETTSLLGGNAGLIFAETETVTAGGRSVAAGQLADNGGPTQTVALHASTLNPAVDRATDALAPATDQRGLARVDGAPGGPVGELGSYEVQRAPEAGSLIVTTSADIVDFYDDLTSLREALTFADSTTAADTVSFANALSGSTLLLTQGELRVGRSVTIIGDLDGDGDADITLDAQGNSRVINAREAPELSLVGLRITGGASTDLSGGAIRAATLTVRDSVIEGNQAVGKGGGLAATNVTLIDSTVRNNSTTGEGATGGGIQAVTATIIDSFVTGNRTLGGNGDGGGVYATQLTLENSTVSGNRTDGRFADGGGLRAATGTITDSIIADNRTIGQDSDGGGIFADDLTISASSITGNSTRGAQAGGGGLSVGDVTIEGSIVSGNRTYGTASSGGGLSAGQATIGDSRFERNITFGLGADGGAIAGDDIEIARSTVDSNATHGARADGGGISASSLNLDSSTVSINSTSGRNASGGGVAAEEGQLVNSTVARNFTTGDGASGGGISGETVALTHTTVTDNSTSGNGTQAGGGGIAGESVTLVNTIVLGNHAAHGATEIAGEVTRDHSIVGGDPGISAAQVFGHPTAGQLADNGGPTQTVALRVSALNPALDAANDLAAPSTDQRGEARLDAVPGGGVADLGAFESAIAPETPSLVVTTLQDIDDGADGLISLREALEFAESTPAADTISFAASLAGGAVALELGQLVVTRDLTIDGDLDDDGTADITLSGEQSTRLFLVSGTGTDLTLDGLKLTQGRAGGDGGAILAQAGTTLTIEDSSVTASSASGSGGAIFADALAITRSTITGNTAGNRGGGISAHEVTLTDSSVSGNLAAGPGGGVRGDAVTLLRSTVADNRTTGANGSGGGVSADQATVDQSTISGNSTGGRGAAGGGMSAGALAMTSSTVVGNTTSGDLAAGGGLQIGTSTLLNVTITGNSTHGRDARGGGIGGGPVILTNSLLLGNFAAQSDGDESSAAITRDHSIIGGDPDITAARVFAATVVVPGSGGAVLGGRLDDNGGPTATVALRVSAFNPAIDGAGAATAPPLDQRGLPAHDAIPGGGERDIGALELQEGELSTATIGGAPEDFNRSSPNAWLTAWTAVGVVISHKAVGGDPGEPWSPAAFDTRDPGHLAGTDILRGDLGVSGRAGGSQTAPQEIDGSEALRFDLPGDGTTRFTVDFAAFDEGDIARIEALDASGTSLGSFTATTGHLVVDGLTGAKTLIVSAQAGTFLVDRLSFKLDATLVVGENRTIGDAPVNYNRSDPDAWARAWSAPGVAITHKGDFGDIGEDWSAVDFGTSRIGQLDGADIYKGDLGVSGRTASTGAVPQEIDGSEALRFHFDDPINGFLIHFAALGVTDAAKVEAFDAQGASLGSVTSTDLLADLSGLDDATDLIVTAAHGSFLIDSLTYAISPGDTFLG